LIYRHRRNWNRTIKSSIRIITSSVVAIYILVKWLNSTAPQTDLMVYILAIGYGLAEFIGVVENW